MANAVHGWIPTTIGDMGLETSWSSGIAPRVRAAGVLTLAGNAANGETVTLGGKVYTWDAAPLADVDGNVLAEFSEPDPPYRGPFDNPRGVAVDALNRIVVADTGNWRVVQVTLHEVFLPLVLRP